MRFVFFLFPIFLQAQCLIPTDSYRLVCADEVRYADSIASGSRLYISSKNAFVTSPRSIFNLVNGYGQFFIQITNSANSQKVAINRAWVNRIDSTGAGKALIYIKDINVTFTTVESYSSVKDSAISCFKRAVASGLATLSDGDYGDVVVSGGGFVMTVDKPDLGLHNLADGDFSVVADSTALSLTNTRQITLQTKNIDGWISRYLQTNNSITLRTNATGKNSRIFVDSTGAQFQFVNGSNNASLRIGDSVAVRFNTSGSVGQVLTVTSIDGDGRLVINPKTKSGSLDSIANSSVTWAKLANPVKDSIQLIRGVDRGELSDSTFSIRADFPIDTSFTSEDTPFYTLEDSFTLVRFRNITVSLVANADTASRLSFPAADAAYEGVTFYVNGTGDGTTQLVFFNTDLNGTELLLTLGAGETVVVRVAQGDGGWIWVAVKSSAFTDRNGIISALPSGDVDITGAASSDLRIRNSRIQFDARMKIGADSSFIHDPAQDTTVIKGDIVLGKFCTNNTYPFSMRNAANSSTTLLIESGATTGYAGLKLVSYNLPSQIEFGGTTSKYLNFYNANNARNVLSVGTNTNARTVLVGNVNPAVNGALIVNDTITSGKGLVYFRKTSSSSTPILTLTSVGNDRHVFHDDGRVFFNNLGTGTATQTLGLTSSGQVVPYTQVFPTAHVSAIDANVDITAQVNSSITTYVSCYLSVLGDRTITLPAPSSTLAGRSVVTSYTAAGDGGYNLYWDATTGDFWYTNATTGIPGANALDGWNVGRFTTFVHVCRQINGTWYWVRDSYFDPFIGFSAVESKTSVTGTTLTFTSSIPTGAYLSSKVMLFKNGLLLAETTDYTITDNDPLTITLVSASISGDKWRYVFKY